MVRRVIMFLSVACCRLCLAEDFVLTDGTVLQDARLMRKEADSAVVSHSAGVARVKFDRLSPELQQRFGLTPENVRAHFDKVQQARRDQAEAEERRAAAQRAALESSKQIPRYLTGADLIAIFSHRDTLSAAYAEYLAAEWNRREAARFNLTVEAKRFGEEADRLAPRADEERAAAAEEKQKVAELKSQLKEAQKDIRRARDTVHLQKEEIARLTELASRNNTGTIVVSRPTYVPVYPPAPIVLPPAITRPVPPLPPPPNRPPLPPPGPRPKVLNHR